MSLKEQIGDDLKTAMKAREQLTVDTLRSALSAFGYKKVEKNGSELSSEEELAVLQKLVKQRNDSINEYTKAGRTELARQRSKRARDSGALFTCSKIRG